MKSLSDINIEKSRSGVYKDNEENRRLHRVGQRYGEPKKEESSHEASTLPTKEDLESSKDGSSIVVENVQTGNTVIFYSKKDGRWFSNHAMMTGGIDTNPERMSRTLQGYNKKPYSIKPDLNVEERVSDIQDLKRDKKEAEDALKRLRKTRFLYDAYKGGDEKYKRAVQNLQNKIDTLGQEITRRNAKSKKPTSIRVKGGTFKVDDNGRILASAHGPQENVSKLLKFASENGYKLDWKEVNEEPERRVDKYARGGYLGIGFGVKTDWDDRQHRLTKILVGLAEQNSDLKNRLVDEVLKIRRDVDGWHFKNEKEARDLALFNFRNWVNRLETEDKLKYIKEASGVNNGGESLGDIESIMEDISDKFFDSKVSAKEKRTYIEKYIGEGEYDRLWQKLSSKQFDSSTDEKNAFMEEVFEALMNKQSVQSKPEVKTPSKVKNEGGSIGSGKKENGAKEGKFSRVNLPDIPNAHKVNLSKYLSAKRKKAVDDAWDKAKFDSLPREKAGVFQEGYNKLREQFNNNFDDMSKSERAELLYKILKMKNAMERK